MHLIAPLACGVRGSESGSVSILKRGTSTRATYYTGFDGSGGVTPSADVTLDANGGGIFYVNELCDVVCKDSSGTTVRTFTAGDSAPGVEVISQSFTGVDYTTGQSGASKPTTLQAALDLLKTSFGTTNFNVLVGSTPTALSTAVANSITSLFFNVKASAYGATGDGSTDDTTAIAAAITAASAAGGGTVFFPKGTYKISAVLTVPAGVSFLGSGAAASIISGAATPYALSMTGTVGTWTYVRDLTINCNQGSIGAHAGWFRVDGCRLVSGASTIAPIYTDDATTRVLAFGCTIELGVNGAYGVNTAAGQVELVGCEFIFPAGVYAGSVIVGGGYTNIQGSVFRLGTVTSGTSTLLGQNLSVLLVTGNIFESVGGGGVPIVNVYDPGIIYGSIESANIFGTGYTFPALTQAAATNKIQPRLSARETNQLSVASEAATVAIPTTTYGLYEIIRSTNAIQTLTFDAPPGAGHWFQLVYNNNQAGAGGIITMGGTNIRGLVTFTVNANKISIYTFRSICVGLPAAKFLWALVSADVNESP